MPEMLPGRDVLGDAHRWTDAGPADEEVLAGAVEPTFLRRWEGRGRHVVMIAVAGSLLLGAVLGAVGRSSWDAGRAEQRALETVDLIASVERADANSEHGASSDTVTVVLNNLGPHEIEVTGLEGSMEGVRLSPADARPVTVPSRLPVAFVLWAGIDCAVLDEIGWLHDLTVHVVTGDGVTREVTVALNKSFLLSRLVDHNCEPLSGPITADDAELTDVTTEQGRLVLRSKLLFSGYGLDQLDQRSLRSVSEAFEVSSRPWSSSSSGTQSGQVDQGESEPVPQLAVLTDWTVRSCSAAAGVRFADLRLISSVWWPDGQARTVLVMIPPELAVDLVRFAVRSCPGQP